MALTETKIKSIKPDVKQKKYYDGQGLFLLVKPNGSKLWRFKYHFYGREKLISFGAYPAVTLKTAREERRKYKELLAQKIDPSVYKNSGNKETFEKVAMEWHSTVSVVLKKGTMRDHLSCLNRDLFPCFGNVPISEVQPTDVLRCIRKIEDRGTLNTAKRTLSLASRIFRYGVQIGALDRDPCQDLKGALQTRKVVSHAAITDPKEVRILMQDIEKYHAFPSIVAATQMMPHVFVRSSELRFMRWEDVDYEKREWSFDIGKTETQLIVPLSTQVLDILEWIKGFTAGSEFVFAGTKHGGKPIGGDAITLALRDMGYKKGVMTCHGFRAMARTILDEVLEYRVDIIELQLAHAVKDMNGNAYNRTKHLDKRHEMMQSWSNYLYELRDS